METIRTTKMKRLCNITNDLLGEMVKENHVELSKYQTLNSLFASLISDLLNAVQFPYKSYQVNSKAITFWASNE
jgi:hypothetical protein